MITLIKGTAYLHELRPVQLRDLILSEDMTCAYIAEPKHVGTMRQVVIKNSRKTGPAERKRRRHEETKERGQADASATI